MYRFNNVIFILFALLLSLQSHAAQTLDRIIAIVNDDVITSQELQQRIEDFKRQMTMKGAPVPSDDIMHKQVLERMVLDSIQLQLAKAQGIRIDDLTLNRMLESIASNNKTSLDQLRRSLQAQGISFSTFREQTRDDMVIRQLQQRMILSRVSVSEQEIDQFLEQQGQLGADDKYHIAHILIATPEAAAPDDIQAAFDRAEKVRAHLQDGEPFRNVALQFSEGRQALDGGDLGWRSAAELPALFLQAVQQMNKGDISPALRSAGGFHIIKLVDKKTQQHIVKQTHARHILMRPDQITSEDQVRQKMNELKKRLKNGEDFAKLAAEFSQDPGSKNNGGDLGWTSPGSFVPRFEKVMDSLQPMQISEPFRSQFGWHIVQVLERRQEDETEQLKRSRAEEAIKQRKADEELQLWLRRIRDEAYVEYRTENGA